MATAVEAWEVEAGTGDASRTTIEGVGTVRRGVCSSSASPSLSSVRITLSYGGGGDEGWLDLAGGVSVSVSSSPIGPCVTLKLSFRGAHIEDSVEVRMIGVGAIGDAISTSWMSGVIMSDIVNEGRRTVLSVVSRRGSGSGRPEVEADRPERLRRADGEALGVGSGGSSEGVGAETVA